MTKPGKRFTPSLRSEPDPARQAAGIWSLYVIGGTDGDFLRRLLDHDHESVRAWAIRLLTDDLPLDTVFSQQAWAGRRSAADLLAKLAAMARDDPSGLVRLVLASTLQRLPVHRRIDLARALVVTRGRRLRPQPARADLDGPYPGRRSESAALASLGVRTAALPSVVRLIARRLGEDIDSRPAPAQCVAGCRGLAAG